MNESEDDLPKPGPQNRLGRAAGAAAPSGGRELREASDRGGDVPKQGLRDWLRQTAGAAAPSGGTLRYLRANGEVK
ncbi:MAG: hypothetical protein B7X59_09005 [Polaromonas sp. 39-63-203]|jgi:hypothetical protein|nr:MAG: hypothetical protein B7Y54_08320 [Polaromonas sp. 35-63-240]OYZ82070.1 MAG: hypothetical protein B7Y03_11555 [Polaromonas sp. 24-62-144]OZA96851.1 MAG: hypothetical protein B7X59_09005 [Polaromonas sp. 39-63-203]